MTEQAVVFQLKDNILERVGVLCLSKVVLCFKASNSAVWQAMSACMSSVPRVALSATVDEIFKLCF